MRLFLAGENNKHRIIKEIADMNIFLAGTESRCYVLDDAANLRLYILDSFYTVEKNKCAVDMLKYYGDYLLDSGAFTFMNSSGHEDWESYIERYADFINRNDIQKFFELDIDSIVGYDRVKEFRHRLEELTNRQCIPVWHISRGKEEFTRMCQEYGYIAIGGIVTKEITPDKYKYFPYFIKEAHRHGAKIHGLGFTNLKLLTQYHFDSVDSTSWTCGNRFGKVFWFDGKTMREKKKIAGVQKMAQPRELAKHNFFEWLKFQKYAEEHL